MRKNLIKILACLMCFSTMAVVNVYAQTITTNQTGTHDGYYYLFWSDGVGSVNMNLGPGGNYSVNWSNCWSFVCGKGWNPGTARTITYSGSFNPGTNSWLGVYGFTKSNPDMIYSVEYFIVENYGAWTPPGGAPSGTLNSDGGTYNLYRTQRNSVIGILNGYQYWSVRTTKRTSGTVTLSNHFNAWASKGWNLGTHDFQIMATEGYQSTGSSNITVSDTTNPTPTPTQESGNYVVSYVIQSSTDTCGTVNCAIKNNTSAAVNGWTLVFNLPSGTTISNLWNGSYTQSGTTVTVKNAGWNGTIGANGGSVNFGFNYNGSNGAGSGFTLNGTACAVQ